MAGTSGDVTSRSKAGVWKAVADRLSWRRAGDDKVVDRPEPYRWTLTCMNSELNGTRSANYDLEERLIAFGVKIISLCEGMPESPAGRHLSRQLLRSGTSPALNYAEARAGESHRDFTHKLKVVLKELRESWVNLRMTDGAALHGNKLLVRSVLSECHELVSIFTRSVRTAERKSPPKN